MTIYRALAVLCVVSFLVSAAEAQTLTVYDDALQNSFTDQSYVNAGSADFNSTLQPRTGTKSIRFEGDNFGAVVFDRTGVANTSTATYPVLRFWVHGGAAGGQQLRVLLQKDNVYFPGGGADVDSFITGGAIAAGSFREVVIDLTQPPFSADAFDRIEIQSDTAPLQAALFIDDVTLGQVAAGPTPSLQIIANDTVAGMLHERFIWRDSNNQPREAALAYNSGQVGPGGSYGGALRQFKYQLPNGSTRTAGLTGYGIGDAGFGYVVMHASGSACLGDDSPIGGLQPGNGFERVFEGRHHAIFRFRQNYPRNCAATGGAAARTIPATIDWIFSTGHDNPGWAVTYDINLAAPAAVEGTFNDDSRAPYGELAIDGEGFTDLDGVAWGDRYKFTNTGAGPVTLNSAWTWNVANTVPWVKEWLVGPLTVDNKHDATMGIVQTQTLAQQDAGGGRNAGAGSMTNFWNTTSAAVGNACNHPGPPPPPIRVHPFPCADDWPYQANANSLDFEFPNGSVNARLTWKTQFGFIGQTTYTTYNGLVATAPGWPKKSYSTYIVLGTHSSAPVEAQLGQVEAVQTVTFTPTIGTVVTSGPAGVTRADNVTFAPPGYNHVYGALALNAAGNQIDMDINVGAGTLKKPLIIVGNYTAGDPQVVRYGGQALVADQDYFASPRPTASELWITLARDVTGAGNRLEITGGGGALGTPANFSATATGTTTVTLSWTTVPGAVNYEIQRGTNVASIAALPASPVAGTPYNDTTVAANTSYLYKIRALGPGGPSAFTPIDVATTVIFTDDPLNSGTAVKPVHITQLRTAANALRAAAVGLAPQAFTDPGLASGTTIKAVHITELRTAIDQARSNIGLTAIDYVEAIAGGVTPVKTLHITKLRDGVK